MLTQDSNNSKQNHRHNVHKHLAAVLCIWTNESGRYEEQPQPLLGSPLGDSLKEIPHAHADLVELFLHAAVVPFLFLGFFFLKFLWEWVVLPAAFLYSSSRMSLRS